MSAAHRDRLHCSTPAESSALGPGGPCDAIGGRVADTKAFGFVAFGTRPGAPREIRATLLGEDQGSRNFASDFEGPTLDRWYIHNQ